MAPPDDAADLDAPAPAPEPVLVEGHPTTVSADGMLTVHVPKDELPAVVTALRLQGYAICLDVTAVDYLTYGAPRDLPAGVAGARFELVVTLLSHHERQRLRLKAQVPEDDLTVPTLFGVHPGTEALEREVYDMYGIVFDGHPDPSRILMPEDWEGHPLRKDFAVGRIPVQFKDAPQGR